MKINELVILSLWLFGFSALTNAEWYPSEYGPEDTLGAANHLSDEKTALAARLVKSGKVYSLGVDISSKSPPLPSGPREYNLGLVQPAAGPQGQLSWHAGGRGITRGANKLSANADFMTIWMGIGTQLEGLAHIGIDNVYYNGAKSEDIVTPNGVTRYSIHTIPPLVGRGVLLNVAAVKSVDHLPAGYAISLEDIRAAEKASGITVGRGDIVLVHTGWLAASEAFKAEKPGMQPGLGVAAAKYLASKNVVAIGADNDAVESIPFEDPTMVFPVHTEMITKRGVYLMENVFTQALADDGANEFLFVLGQPKFVGAVQAVVNPIAIR